MTQTLIVIPARMQARRLPGKPLADICGEPMIVHVWRRAVESGAGRVAVATDAQEIHAVIAQAGGDVVMTRGDHESGTDRVFEAVEALDPDGACEIVVNLQGDLPSLEPHLIGACIEALNEPVTDIGTLAAEISDESERDDPNVVKVIAAPGTQERIMRALYFTRARAPYGDGPHYHHIGIYAFRRAALARFVALPRSLLEKREKLEQLRALEAGMRIGVALVDTAPAGVDTPADLELARALLGKPGKQ